MKRRFYRNGLLVLMFGLLFVENIYSQQATTQSSIRLPNRRLTVMERSEWIAEYRAMGGPTANELEVMRLVNIERAKLGLSQLDWDDTLGMAARFFAQQAHDLRGLHSGSHNFGPYASDKTAQHGASANVAAAFGARLRWNGGNWFSSGSMIAKDLVVGWMNSPGHRRYIISPEHRFIGAGQYPGGISYMYLSDQRSDNLQTENENRQQSTNNKQQIVNNNKQQNADNQETTNSKGQRNADSRVQHFLGFTGSLGIYFNGWNENILSAGIPLQLGLRYRNTGGFAINIIGEVGAGIGTLSFTDLAAPLLEWNYGGMCELYWKSVGLGFGYGIVDSMSLNIFDWESSIPFNTTYMRFALIFLNRSKFSIYGQHYGRENWGGGIQWGRSFGK